jgi:hypothetical protein
LIAVIPGDDSSGKEVIGQDIDYDSWLRFREIKSFWMEGKSPKRFLS